jgi:hypothetical protein
VASADDDRFDVVVVSVGGDRDHGELSPSDIRSSAAEHASPAGRTTVNSIELGRTVRLPRWRPRRNVTVSFPRLRRRVAGTFVTRASSPSACPGVHQRPSGFSHPSGEIGTLCSGRGEM